MKEEAIKREIWGLRLELIGLLVALITIAWQVTATEWWEIQLREWQSFIQEDVNLAVLVAIQDMGRLSVEEDKNNKNHIVEKINDNISRAYFKAIEQRDQRRKAINEGQPNLFNNIRFFLLVIGAIFIIVGKWLTLRSKSLYGCQEQPQSPEAP